MRTVVFINAHSRRAGHHLRAIRRYFASTRSPFKLLEIIVVEDLAKFDEYLARLKSHKTMQCVIVGSGDGTILGVLNALKGRPLVYGFLPLGTGNTFVRSLGLPLHCRAALKILGRQHIRYAALGSINGTLFPNIAGVGVTTEVIEKLPAQWKRRLGVFSYMITAVHEIFRHDAVWCELRIGDEIRTFYTHDIIVANGRWRGMVAVDATTSAYQDSLTIAGSTAVSVWRYLQDAWSFVIKRQQKRPHVFLMQAKRAELRTDPVQPIQADGELIGYTPAIIEVVKKAIRVLAPPEATKAPKKRLRQSKPPRRRQPPPQ